MFKSVCPLTGEEVDMEQSNTSMSFYYETSKTGRIHFSDVALNQASQLSPEEKNILIGICRNHSIRNEPMNMITSAFLSQLNNQEIPYSFEARARHLLKYLYDNGGREYKAFALNSSRDSPITYSSREEFERILRYLESEEYIVFKKTLTKSTNFYQDLSLTKGGISEIEKGQIKMPMFGLVTQIIKTGDINIDNQIEFSRKSFFDDNSTLESKRTACEGLCFVLEPLRNELKTLFQGDTEVFFNLVNNFNIRHNKTTTKSIEHEEQLEWIFYSLLNTINTYYKLKRKLGS